MERICGNCIYFEECQERACLVDFREDDAACDDFEEEKR